MSETKTRTIPPVVWHPDDDGLERAIVFEPGYNNRHKPQGGVHGMAFRFLLRGPKGATQFLMNAGWVPGEKMSPRIADLYPSGSDVGYHARRAQYDGAYERNSCDYLDGDSCFYDGSSLAAKAVVAAFIEEGELAVWRVLREWYDRLDKEEE